MSNKLYCFNIEYFVFLGQCYLTPSGDHGESGDYRCFPSEGGHAEFAPRDEVLKVTLILYANNLDGFLSISIMFD